MVLAADPAAAWAAADDAPVGGELEQDPGGDVLLASVRLTFGDLDRCPQAGDVGRQLGPGRLPTLGERRDGLVVELP